MLSIVPECYPAFLPDKTSRHMKAAIPLSLLVSVLAGCMTSQLGPSIRGTSDRFSVDIGIDYAKERGGSDSEAVKRIIDDEVRRAGYCPEGYTVRLAGNTAATLVYVGRCTKKADGVS